jgi:RNA polymerase sigma-70 factor, ECF subfamily
MTVAAEALYRTMTERSTQYEPTLSTERQSEFVAAHMRRIFLLIFRIVRSVPDAQDLTQETFIKALQRQDQIKDLDKAGHWLSRIAHNTAIDFLRRSGRAQFSDIDEIPERLAVSTEEDAEQSVLRTERYGRMQEALEVLTERERTALLLRDVEDLPAEEVAERLQCSKATVRSHIANARVKLRRFLEGRPL